MFGAHFGHPEHAHGWFFISLAFGNSTLANSMPWKLRLLPNAPYTSTKCACVGYKGYVTLSLYLNIFKNSKSVSRSNYRASMYNTNIIKNISKVKSYEKQLPDLGYFRIVQNETGIQNYYFYFRCRVDVEWVWSGCGVNVEWMCVKKCSQNI
jgi:hypothetical protein